MNNFNNNSTVYTNANNKTQKFLELNEIDIWITEFACTANRLFNLGEINIPERTVIETLINDYRIYIQSGETNKDNMKRKIASFMTQGLSIEDKEYNINHVVKHGIKVKFAMETDEKIRQTQIYQQLMESSSELKSDVSTAELLAARLDEQEKRAEERFTQQIINTEENSSKDTLHGINTRLVQMDKMIGKTAEQVGQLTEAMMGKESLIDLDFKLWPDKIKQMVTRGFKQSVFFMIFLPITAPATLILKPYSRLVQGGMVKITSYLIGFLSLIAVWTFIGNVSYILFTPNLILIDTYLPGSPSLKNIPNLQELSDNLFKSERADINAKEIFDILQGNKLEFQNLDNKIIKNYARIALKPLILPSFWAADFVLNMERPIQGYGAGLEAIRDLFDAGQIQVFNDNKEYYQAEAKYQLCESNKFTKMLGCDKPIFKDDRIKYEEKLKTYEECKSSWISGLSGCGEKPVEPVYQKTIKKEQKNTYANLLIGYFQSIREFWTDPQDLDPPKAPEL